MTVNVHVIECTSDPVAAPPGVGVHWINTISKRKWFSVGTSTVADWALEFKPEIFQASQISTQENTGVVATVVPINLTQVQNNATANYAFAASTVLTIAAAGKYKFTMSVTTDTENGAREHGESKLQRWDGAAFVDIPDTEAHSKFYSYSRNAASGENTPSLTTILDVVAGQQFRLALSSPSGGPIKTVSSGTGLIVELVS